MGIRWLKMGKMSEKITQDGGKMRNMRDVSSGLPTPWGQGTVRPANNPASRGPGEGYMGDVLPPLEKGTEGGLIT